MTVKHLQIVTLWLAAITSAVLFFLSSDTLFGGAYARFLLGTSGISIISLSLMTTVFLNKDSKPSFFNFFRVLALLGGMATMLIVFYTAYTIDGYWSEEINGLFFISSGISFCFLMFNYLSSTSSSLMNQKHLQKPVVSDWILILILPVLLIVYAVMSLYNEETLVSSAGDPDFTVQPGVLMDAFEKDAEGSNRKYIGKVIRFSGTIAEIGGDSSILFSLNAWKEGYSVNCEFDQVLKDKLSAVLEGDSVLMQCSCSGLSVPEEGMSLLSESTLEMTRCALIDNFKNTPNLGTDVEHPRETPKNKRK
jgi:hypothetical protein